MYKLKREARNITWSAGDSWNAFMRRPPRPRRATDDEQNVGAPIQEVDHALSPTTNPALPENHAPSTSYESVDGQATKRANRVDKSDQDADVEQEASAQDAEAVPDEEDESTDGAEKSLYRRLFLDNPVPVGMQVRAVLFPHWYTVNWLLIAVPVGIALHFVKGMSPLAVFVVNFLAIIPLAGILSFATEEVALRVGEVIGGLLNASFGNAVELIVSIIALAKKNILIVQTSLIGSMLSNLLLVLGMCFFFGGVNRLEQFFNTTVAQTAASLLALAVASLVIPTAYSWGNPDFDPHKSSADEQLSRGTAVILLVVYASYLFFQLKSHRSMYNEPSKKVEKRKGGKSMKKALAHMGGFAGASAGGDIGQEKSAQNKAEVREEEEQPSLSFVGAVVTLCAATALVGICAEFLVDSINDVTCENNVSPYFVGLILLPIVGNAAEHATAVTVAIKDKMDLSIGVAVGSGMQISLLVIPLSVILGWIIHADMTLIFDNFQIAVLFVSVILVNYLIADGKSHWLEGVLLLALYVIIAIAAWFFPGGDAGSACPAK